MGNQSIFFLSVFTSGKSDLIVIEDGKSGYAYESNVSHALTKESSGGCFPNCETWWKNSQFILNVNVTGEILIVLDNDSQALDSIPIGFAIFKTDNDHAITFSSPGQHLKTSAIAPRANISEFITLEKGKYVVLPFAFEKNAPLQYTLSVYSDVSCDSIVPVTPWPSHYMFSSKWTDELSGGWYRATCCWLLCLVIILVSGPMYVQYLVLIENVFFFSFLFWIFSVNNKQTWLNNPFCSFVVKGDATIVSIEMTQPRTQNYPVGIAIFKGVYPLDNIASRIVGGKPWHQNKYLAKLDGGGQTYLIMAQTFDKHLLGDFQIRILSDGAVDMLQGENSMSGGGGVVNIK